MMGLGGRSRGTELDMTEISTDVYSAFASYVQGPGCWSLTTI